MQKNVAGQKWRVFAYNRTTQVPQTGDAANITALISIDGAAAGATNDVNPTEISGGFYEFDLTQAETNGYELLIIPSSVTAGIQVIGAPATVTTTPVAWPTDVVQTGDSFNRIGAAGASLTSLGDIRIANLDATISSRLSPTISGRTLDVTVGGEAGIDWSNVSNPSTVLNLSGTTISAEGIADAVWDEAAAGHVTAGTFGSIVSAISTVLSGITSLGDWLRRAFRKDVGTAGMATAEAEIQTGGTATYLGTTDNLEAIKDAGGGGGGGDALEATSQEILTTVNSIQSSLAGLTVTVTGYASIDSDGVLQLKRAHTATLTFTSVSNDLVPDLSAVDTKVFIGIKDAAGREWLSLEGTVLVATGLQSVRFTISAVTAAAIPKGTHFFDVIAVYGYDSSLSPPYTSLVPFTSGRANVTDIYLNPLDL